MSERKYCLMIHGGIGSLRERSVDGREAYRRSLHSVLGYGASLLEGGETALDVVEQCVSLLEDDPLFNAGRGSVLTAEGKIECDAAIMNGRTLEAGAVARIANIKNPVQLARLVMERSGHVFLVGDGALKFADEQRIPRLEESYFVTERRVEEWKQAQSAEQRVLGDAGNVDKKYGTVGAVARDTHGNLTAATSSGGIVNKKYGRVGDCPVIGAGTFAENDTCAVSATGYGEQIIRFVLAKTIADLVRYRGLDAQTAAEQAINFFIKQVKGFGGVIVVDYEGRHGVAYSTPNMLFGKVGDNQEIDVHV